MLNEEQANNIKAQILKQIESFPEEQQVQAREQIEAMNSEELEEFLKKNNLVKNSQSKEKQECVFCLILKGEVPSYKLDENKKSLAILEINPLSQGHSLVISKNHSKLESSAFTLANKISKKIKSVLNSQEVKIESSKVFGHELINIIPLYKDKKLEKKKATEQELQELQNKLKSKPKQKREKKIKSKDEPKEKLERLPKAPRRIP